ncbi:hypothetical protein NQZ68_039285 [Dissostichus eleginoides]|nr:hypothetical protein NQZ68_039285 [Dissostichus eleginoides]
MPRPQTRIPRCETSCSSLQRFFSSWTRVGFSSNHRKTKNSHTSSRRHFASCYRLQVHIREQQRSKCNRGS